MPPSLWKRNRIKVKTEIIDKVHFGVVGANVIRQTAACEVRNPTATVDPYLQGSLHDLRMGSFRQLSCKTCGSDQANCVGHHGYIELRCPVLKLNFVDNLLRPALQNFCAACGRADVNCSCFKHDETESVSHQRKRRRTTNCSRIKLVRPKKGTYAKHWRSGFKFQIIVNDEEEISIRDLYNIMKNSPKEDLRHLLKDPGINIDTAFRDVDGIADACFWTALPVLPTCARPVTFFKGNWEAGAVTKLYIGVLSRNVHLLTTQVSFEEHRDDLQNSVNELMDTSSSSQGLPRQITDVGGLRQAMDGKYGILRRHLMGKRVDFCARSVASGDPRLRINEVGVPSAVCNTLTTPERVTELNIASIRSGKIKGHYLQRGNQRFDLLSRPELQRTAQVGDVLDRVLRTGDVVALGRQPTLHRGSMMGLRIREFHNSLTFRLNVSTATPLNCDFDGDCINIYVPQDQESRAEIDELMQASTNIVSSQSAKPLMGLVQDALLGSYLLCKALLRRDEVMQIMMEIEKPFVDLPQPAIFAIVNGHLECKWTGIQIIQLILDQFCPGVFKTKGYDQGGFIMTANTGTIVSGTLNKSCAGVSDGSIFHHIFLHKGHRVAAKVMFAIQMAALCYLDTYGFSVGIGDMVDTGQENHTENVSGLDEMLYKDQWEKGKQPDEGDLCDALSSLLVRPPPDTNSQSSSDNRLLVLTHGARSKGNVTNWNQITRCVGQQMDTSGRVAKRMSHGTRTLPHFSKYDPGLDANGFVHSSFVKGLRPHEFFFHALSSRLGLVDTSQKTAVSGYAQRKLIKTLEQLQVTQGPDDTRPVVNMATGAIVQFNAGEDGRDAAYTKLVQNVNR